MKSFSVSEMTINIKSFIVSWRRNLQQSGLSPKFYRRNKWVLSRTACLGNDSAELISSIRRLKYPRINFQKNRIDHLNFLLMGGKTRVARKDDLKNVSIFSLVKKQRKLNLRFHAQPLLVLIDTYSELTDQEFITSDGRTFFANYSDVSPQKLSNNEIFCLGRIKPLEIYSNYSKFCEAIMARWPKTKIVFVTYPTAFESRTTYLQQSYAIDEAIQLLVRDFSGIKIINIPDEAIYCDERTDNFPYHFGISAKAYVARELESWVETLI